MIVLSANNLTKTYGTDVIIDKASFHLNAGDKVGIIGRNGAGKTTLLNMLTGELPCDEGEFFVSQNMRIGYLKQRDNFSSEGTVLEEIEGIFSGLRELENEIAELSDKVAENPHDTKMMCGISSQLGEHRMRTKYNVGSSANILISRPER